MVIINQPRVARFGDVLCNLIENGGDCSDVVFYIVSAYAKRSGIRRIETQLGEFKRRNGRIIAIIGLDQKVTSIQALTKLYELVDELYVFHSEDFSQTFHPKIYTIERSSASATVIIGSANLTSGGLYTNYEAAYMKDYNLGDESDSREYEEIKRMIESYKDLTSNCCKRVTEELLTQLIQQHYLANEEVRIYFGTSSGADQSSPLFGRERFTPPPVTVTRPDTTDTGSSSVTEYIGGFYKKLSRFDVSTTSAPGQIIIPIRFLQFFPVFSQAQTTAANASQSEAFFNITFIDQEETQLRVDGVRIIHYFPAPNHPRPNHELRFTFRSREILDRLSEGDILEFRRTTNPDIWFEIRLINSHHARYSTLIGRFGILDE